MDVQGACPGVGAGADGADSTAAAVRAVHSLLHCPLKDRDMGKRGHNAGFTIS